MGFFPAHSVLAVVLTGSAANCTAVSCRKPLLFEESTTMKIEKPKKLLMPSSLCQLQNICFSAVNLLVLFSASNLFFFFLISCSKLFFIYLYHHSFISLNGGNPLKLFQRFREEWLAGKHCVAAASIIPFAHQFPFSLDLNEMQAHNVARLFCDHTLLLHLCKQSTLWGST